MDSKNEIYLAQTYSCSAKTTKIILSPLLSSYVSLLIGKFIGRIQINRCDVNHDVQFYVVYHSLADLVSCNQYIFAQDYYSNCERKKIEGGCFYPLNESIDSTSVVQLSNSTPKRPMIHITIFDILKEDRNMSYINEYIYRESSRFKAIMDSSIWNYYLPITEPAISIERFENIVKKIDDNVNKRLYRYCVTNEYVELNARLVRNSYLSRELRAHGSFVSPFVFHSESEMEKELYRCLDSEKHTRAKNFCCSAKWRMLLLDDYANKPLKEIETEDVSQRSSRSKTDGDEYEYMAVKVTGKLKVIIDDLQSKGCTDIVWCCPSEAEINERYENRNNNQWELKPWSWYDINGDRVEKYTDPDIAIVCATNVKHAFQLLILQRYDIVLLDYLLGDRKDKKGREYSYYLLKLIYDKCNLADVGDQSSFASLDIEDDGNVNKTDLLGPDGCLYFMHISAFVSAIQERLREQHLLRNEPFWHIAHGACPTNTPELFLYYLYRIMKKRYESIMIQDGQEVGSLIHFLDGIYKENPRMQSVNKFNTLLNLRAQYNRIKNDVYKEEHELLKMKSGDSFINGCSPLDCRSSRLISSTFPDILFYGNSFWEHLQHLIYLTAYGTIRQWTEMWEEYSFIKPRLVLNEKKGKKVCRAIENYIIALKNNS